MCPRVQGAPCPPCAHLPVRPQVFPKQLLLRELPLEVDILCTHPMFGPDSGKGSWGGLNFMYEKVRTAQDPRREKRVELFLKVRCGAGRCGAVRGGVVWCASGNGVSSGCGSSAAPSMWAGRTLHRRSLQGWMRPAWQRA